MRLARAAEAILTLAALASALVVWTRNPAWALVALASGLAYGFVSPLVAARRLYFLAGAAPHAALLAAAVGVSLWYTIGVPPYAAMLVIGTALVYIVGYAIFKGVDPDVATSTFVGAASATSVLVLYYLLSRYPASGDVSALFIGDPLLVSIKDAVAAMAVALTVALISAMTFKEQAYIGFDRDDARLAGLRVWAYDLALFTALALATVGLIPVVGFILEHILVLIPAAAAATIAGSAGEALKLSAALATASTALGMLTAILADVAPSGAAGAILLALYAAGIIYRRRAGEER